MALIVRSVPWSAQPQVPSAVNWSNPISRDLVALVLPRVEVVGQGKPTISGAASFSAGQGGVAAKTVFTGTGANDFVYPASINIAGDRTFIAYASNVGGVDNIPTLTVSGTNNDWLYIGATQFKAYLDNNPDAIISISESATPRLYAARQVGAVVKGSVNSVFNSGSVTGGRSQVASSLRIGRDNLGSNSVDCQVFLAGYWGRALSDSEIASLAANPWQLFAPQRRIITLAGAAGIPTLSAPTAFNITSTTAQPRVTLTF